jgi:hypothetical protein
MDMNSFGFASIEGQATFYRVKWPLLGGGKRVDKSLRFCALGSGLEVRLFRNTQSCVAATQIRGGENTIKVIFTQ